MTRWLREPLVQFLLIGGLLFAVYAATGRGTGSESSQEIRLNYDDLAQLVLLFQSQWRRDPTPEELGRLVENRVQEEVLYREGLALGLDKGDTIVKRRMAQKMQFLAEDVAAAHEPSKEELQTWYQKNRDAFTQPPRVSFRHLYFSPDRRGARTRDDAAAALAKLTGEPQDTKLASALTDRFMFQDYYRERAPENLAKDFGPKFAFEVAKLPSGSWQGPIESGYGWHLVFIDTVVPGRAPTFEEIEPDVKVAWLAEQKAKAWENAYREMRAKYTVLLAAPPDAASASAAAGIRRQDVPTPSGEGGS
jgi:hypothetical protein